MADSVVLRASKNALALTASKNTVALSASKNSVREFDPAGTLPDVVWAFITPNMIISVANVAGV